MAALTVVSAMPTAVPAATMSRAVVTTRRHDRIAGLVSPCLRCARVNAHITTTTNTGRMIAVSRSQLRNGPCARSMAPTAPWSEVRMNPSAAAMTMASTKTVAHGSGTLPRKAAKRTNGSCAGSVSVVGTVVMGFTSLTLWGSVGRSSRGMARCLPSRVSSARAGTDPLSVRAGHQAPYGTIVQPNIMAWSSCARLWQCATYGPTKSRKPR